jgi:hypothetical protein
MFGERGGDFNYNAKEQIRILTKIPNAQVTLMSGITLGLQFTLLYKRDISFRISPSLQNRSFGRVEETISKVFKQNTHKKRMYFPI